MKNKIIYLSCFILLSLTSFSQSISSSPYSLYGVGSLYESDFGILPSIGSSGMALPSTTFINNLNPASLAYLPLNHFMFDIGGKAIATTYQSGSRTENRNNFQFSHMAFAFPVTKNSGFSVALRPYSSAAFKISNLKLPITNSQEYYYLTAVGSGGLNNFDFSYGYRFGKKFSAGVSGSVLFGNTVDERNFLITNTLTTISKKTNYNGLRATLGAQYKIDSTFTVASTVKLPAQIKASKVQSVETIADEVTTTVETDVASDVDDYYMPLEIGVGISKRFKNNLNMTFDYEKSLWNNTSQSELYGDFVNQDRFALGFTYSSKKNVRKYWDRIQYAMGANFDNGYLEVDGKRISNAAISIGLSLPIENTFSTLNISYSYGQKGRISDNLIKENYHKISLNLSLDGIWFVKRKFE
ncbi:aromatic hydrocarbon degradation protein [Flavobacterium sp. JLP]|uniref:aromatic hydrocarbon degradation protein n=1 Tax=unclassified Flavobacterium TaxID=196869 RepID=UPI00188C31F9|nr:MULTISPECIES: aromatic hydrocarbon degradation protein [unclassified Flavobacterium]MBF4494729.1 aromatic hydrocarbon degradation protein [Flavobacterium sp. MR2016-29]MBF4508544.1 aromatic hydrocarbon degradation protein [Flavobacterium sp. JLP]